MELSRSLLAEKAEEYERAEPLAVRELDHLEAFPEAFATGEYGWKDAEWVVRWYFRRYLGAYDDQRRQEIEEAFGDNDFDDVRDAISATREADDVESRVRRLTTLAGVTVPVASAFLQFLDPESFVVVDDRAWGALVEADELGEPYPDPPSPSDYRRYLETCRALADEFDCDLQEVYRALWRLGSEA